MHIPENYLSPTTCAVMGAAMVPVLAVAIKKVRKEVPPEKMPLIGVGAAFAFLVMMFNVPLPGGTTGHAVGAVLAAVLLGPYAACLAVTVALALQALLFGDGGVLALGANCFNMAFVMPMVGYGVYTLCKSAVKKPAGAYAGMALGGYVGLNAAALFTAVEFGLQPALFAAPDGTPLYCPYPLSVSIPAMMAPHLLVAGFIEAAFTALVGAFVMKAAPEALDDARGGGRRQVAVYALVAAMICLAPLGLLAAGTAWGEWGAEEIAEVVTGGKALGFVPAGLENGFSFEALMPDYTVAGLPETAGYVLCALFGAAVSIILFRLLAGLGKRRRTA
ncbi:MAG: cobalt transporter CbiM [Acidobacteriota bacterium]|jgi:cobalt/nickel transport system permease protein|nr:cobalt transporter CbiM [Acidobacteriota bacterium]